MEILGRTVMNFRACTSPKRDFDNDRKKRAGPQTGEDAEGQPSAKRPMIVKNPDGTTTTVVKLENDTTQCSQESGVGAPPPSPSGETPLLIALPNKEMALKILQYTQDALSGELTRGNSVNPKYFKQIRKQIGE